MSPVASLGYETFCHHHTRTSSQVQHILGSLWGHGTGVTLLGAADPGHGATGILLLVWICPIGGRGASKEGESCTPGKKGAQGCFQRKCWHKEQALGHSMAGRPGKSPVPSSCLAWGRGDGAAPAGPGTGRVSGGSPSQGPAGFKVTCKAQGGLMPSLPHGWRHLGLLLTCPDLQTPGKGTMALPTPVAAAQLAGDSAPAPTHALPHKLVPV